MSSRSSQTASVKGERGRYVGERTRGRTQKDKAMSGRCCSCTGLLGPFTASGVQKFEISIGCHISPCNGRNQVVTTAISISPWRYHCCQALYSFSRYIIAGKIVAPLSSSDGRRSNTKSAMQAPPFINNEVPCSSFCFRLFTFPISTSIASAVDLPIYIQRSVSLAVECG